MAAKRGIVKPAVWGLYIVIGLEFLFMISPAALYFYSAYGPALNFLHGRPETAWLTSFFLPHFSTTQSPLINVLKPLGFVLAGLGLILFVAGAVQIYSAKLSRRGAVTGGLYRLVRHPQYMALAVLGLGVTLIWSRFLVLFSFVTMLFLYYLLARWEEARCLREHGESYREYQRSTGMLMPRVTGPWRGGQSSGTPPGGLRLAGFYAVAMIGAFVLGLILQDYSLSQVSSLYPGHAVLSPASLSEEELGEAYRLALADGQLAERLAALDGDAKLVVYVVPANWYLPDIPLHGEEEIRREGGGHGTPEFDRRRFRVLFCRARLHARESVGPAIVKRAYGRDPLLVVWVDIGSNRVLGSDEPPDHVIWGDIPTPMF